MEGCLQCPEGLKLLFFKNYLKKKKCPENLQKPLLLAFLFFFPFGNSGFMYLKNSI